MFYYLFVPNVLKMYLKSMPAHQLLKLILHELENVDLLAN